jgi:tetratricopeptide (TPR) repeat protein
MKRLIISSLLIPTLWLACSSSKELTKENEEAILAQAESIGAVDSVGASTKSASGEARKVDPQYLVVKFRQNDTEVEMALDPQSTSLELDLVRGKDGVMSVTKGDSMLYKKDDESNDQLSPPQKDRGGEMLTDEIIRDINLAQKLFYERRYSEALNVLQASLQRKKTATAYALGGSIYFVNGEMASAVQAWENAIQINPNLEDVRQLIMRYKDSQ